MITWPVGFDGGAGCARALPGRAAKAVPAARPSASASRRVSPFAELEDPLRITVPPPVGRAVGRPSAFVSGRLDRGGRARKGSGRSPVGGPRSGCEGCGGSGAGLTSHGIACERLALGALVLTVYGLACGILAVDGVCPGLPAPGRLMPKGHCGTAPAGRRGAAGWRVVLTVHGIACGLFALGALVLTVYGLACGILAVDGACPGLPAPGRLTPKDIAARRLPVGGAGGARGFHGAWHCVRDSCGGRRWFSRCMALCAGFSRWSASVRGCWCREGWCPPDIAARRPPVGGAGGWRVVLTVHGIACELPGMGAVDFHGVWPCVRDSRVGRGRSGHAGAGKAGARRTSLHDACRSAGPAAGACSHGVWHCVRDFRGAAVGSHGVWPCVRASRAGRRRPGMAGPDGWRRPDIAARRLPVGGAVPVRAVLTVHGIACERLRWVPLFSRVWHCARSGSHRLIVAWRGVGRGRVARCGGRARRAGGHSVARRRDVMRGDFVGPVVAGLVGGRLRRAKPPRVLRRVWW